MTFQPNWSLTLNGQFNCTKIRTLHQKVWKSKFVQSSDACSSLHQYIQKWLEGVTLTYGCCCSVVVELHIGLAFGYRVLHWSRPPSLGTAALCLLNEWHFVVTSSYSTFECSAARTGNWSCLSQLAHIVDVSSFWPRKLQWTDWA